MSDHKLISPQSRLYNSTNDQYVGGTAVQPLSEEASDCVRRRQKRGISGFWSRLNSKKTQQNPYD
jgi:hypothetical protein